MVIATDHGIYESDFHFATEQPMPAAVYEDDFGHQVDTDNQRALETQQDFVKERAKSLSDGEFENLSKWYGLDEGTKKNEDFNFDETKKYRDELEDRTKDLPKSKYDPQKNTLEFYSWPSLLMYEIWKERKIKGYRGS